MASAGKGLDPKLVSIHNSLQIVGFFLLSLVLGTALHSKRVTRSANWYLFISLWMVWCIVYFLLVGQQLGPMMAGICMTQGVLVNAIGASTCFAILSISIEVCMTIATSLRARPFKHQRWFTTIIFILPLFVLLLSIIEGLVLAMARPGSIKRRDSGVYCVLRSPTALRMTFFLIVIALGSVVLLKFVTGYLLYRTWSTIRRSKADERNPVSLPLVFRVLVFSTLPVIYIITMAVQMKMKNKEMDTLIILTDLLPIAAALIFGTQSDILQTWVSLLTRKSQEKRPLGETDKEAQMNAF